MRSCCVLGGTVAVINMAGAAYPGLKEVYWLHPPSYRSTPPGRPLQRRGKKRPPKSDYPPLYRAVFPSPRFSALRLSLRSPQCREWAGNGPLSWQLVDTAAITCLDSPCLSWHGGKRTGKKIKSNQIMSQKIRNQWAGEMWAGRPTERPSSLLPIPTLPASLPALQARVCRQTCSSRAPSEL